MTNKVFTVIVDMDEVLVGLLSPWVQILNKKYKLNVKKEQIKNWDMRLAFPTLTAKEIYGVLSNKKLWKNVKPIEGAVSTLKEMYFNPNLNVKICTASHYTAIEPKLCMALFPYFDFLHDTDIITCHDKSLLNADFRIDDYDGNLSGNGIKFLIDKPYNQNADKSSIHYRVKDITEAYNIIKNYTNI